MPRLTRRAVDAALAAADPQTLALLDTWLQQPLLPFPDWCARWTPTWDWQARHLRVMDDACARIRSGEWTRVMTTVPPRHGKTEKMTIRHPVYCLHADPTFRFILGAYNATYAAKISRKARRLARQTGLRLNEERTAVEDWETRAGGGYRAVGVGGGATGQGANGIGIDDPVKSREEADSAIHRDRVWEWYTDDIYTRLEPRGWVMLTMTRWHDDDLAGRILASEDAASWRVIHLPALAEAPDDPLRRKLGEALWPDRFDAETLARIRLTIGEYGFAALYQGSPRPREGVMFARDKVTIVDEIPAQMPAVRYWDKAGTLDGGAYTAGVKVAGPRDGLYYVLDVDRCQLNARERDQRMRVVADVDGSAVTQWCEQEPGSGGKESAQSFIRLMAGYRAYTEPVTGDKVLRAEGWAAQWQAGNVRLLRGAWNKAYLDEAETFPSGRYKDQVDASAGAFQKLVGRAAMGTIRLGLSDHASGWSV